MHTILLNWSDQFQHYDKWPVRIFLPISMLLEFGRGKVQEIGNEVSLQSIG